MDPMLDPNMIGPQVPEMSMQPSPTGDDGKQVPRDPPEPDPARAALVTKITDQVRQAKVHWEPSFKRMREDQDFAVGLQWSQDRNDKRYQANITLRMVAQKTAFLYAKNPKAIAKRREKLMNTVWDGTQTQLQQMQMGLMQSMQTGMIMDPAMQGAVQYLRLP